MTINNPNIDPANNYSLVGVLQTALQSFQQAMQGMLPAQVINYDRTTNRVSVQLMVNIITTGGEQIQRAQLSSIPVMIQGCGAFSISFPVQPGDFGWVLANDRDISLFLQNIENNYTDPAAPPTNTSLPNTTRMNNFADSVFIPDAMKSYNINDSNKNLMIIQSNDGTISIELGIDTTNNNAPSVNINSERINLNITDPTPITGGWVIINGNLWVSGEATSTTGTFGPAVPIKPPYPP